MIERALPIMGILAEGVLLKEAYDCISREKSFLWERFGLVRHAPLFAPSLLALTLRSYRSDPAPSLLKKVVWCSYTIATNSHIGLILCRQLGESILSWPAEKRAQKTLASLQSLLGIGIIVSFLLDESELMISVRGGENVGLMKAGVLFSMAARFSLDLILGTKEPCGLRIAFWAGMSLSSCALLFKELLK
jgi:hypothetical protein